MLTFECNECGEPLQAADQDELVRLLAGHLKSEHGLEPGQDELTELVAAQAYEAMDS